METKAAKIYSSFRERYNILSVELSERFLINFENKFYNIENGMSYSEIENSVFLIKKEILFYSNVYINQIINNHKELLSSLFNVKLDISINDYKVKDYVLIFMNKLFKDLESEMLVISLMNTSVFYLMNKAKSLFSGRIKTFLYMVSLFSINYVTESIFEDCKIHCLDKSPTNGIVKSDGVYSIRVNEEIKKNIKSYIWFNRKGVLTGEYTPSKYGSKEIVLPNEK